MGSPQELLDLSKHLKQEKLYVSSEREQLQTLNKQLTSTSQLLYHTSWISRQQKNNLNLLILADKNVTPEVCYCRANELEGVNFVDGYKHLTYHESKIGECLKRLRESPTLVALFLCHVEKQSLDVMQRVARGVMTGLYGNAVMQNDEHYVLQLLRSLLELQVAPNDNPRRLLRKSTCSFSIIYKLMTDGLFSCKLFLTAALHNPIMQLLMEDEWFYDIDSGRALYRFPAAERVRRFGNPGTDEYAAQTKHYREITTNKIVSLVERFINGLRSNMYCFPPSLAWLVSQCYRTLTKTGRVSHDEARAICGDLILTFFICPAVCDPQPYGITSDAPISYIARHNLMQVAQILQVLTINKWEEIDPKCRDLYDKFDKNCMQFMLDSLLEVPCTEQPMCSQQAVSRAAVFFTLTELIQLLTLMRSYAEAMDEDSPDRKQLEDMLCNVASCSTLQAIRTRTTPNNSPQPTPPGTPGTSKKLGRDEKKKSRRMLLSPEPNSVQIEDNEGKDSQHAELEDVLVISLGTMNECPGMLPENKVLEQESRKKRSQGNSVLPGEDDPISESQIHLNEKRTRFSLSHDQDSIATSDNLEAISEAASSHSYGSDFEEENKGNESDNDNLSDFVSANVSGRGTPNISGRDTPLSMAESSLSMAVEDVEEPEEPPEERPPPPNLPVTVRKSNREDVTDRFGKFDIKQELDRCEIKSTVSDTWSTDVLESDSEPPERGQLERLEEVGEDMARNLLGVQIQEVPEALETASDAWSTDVLASDTSEKQVERLLELDQDDMSSISSRSQIQDDPAGDDPELPGRAGDTPQAPGSYRGLHSPVESLDGISAASGLSDAFHSFDSTDIDNTVRAPDRSIDRSSVHIKTDRFSDPSLNRHTRPRDPYNTGTGYGPQRPASDEIESFTLSDTDSSQIGSPSTVRSAQTGTHEFDPYLPKRHTDLNVHEPASLGSSAQTLVPDNVTSPEHGFPGSMGSLKASSSGNLEQSGSTPRRTPQFGVMSASFPTDSTSVDILANELSDSLKLTEQQNVNIDANRLSRDLTMFDPLENREGGVGKKGGERPSRKNSDSDRHTDRNQPLKNNYMEQGARPKVLPQVPNRTSTPRISVQSDSMDSSRGVNGPNSSNVHGQSAQANTSNITSSGPSSNGPELLPGLEARANGPVMSGDVRPKTSSGEGTHGTPPRHELEGDDDRDKKKSTPGSIFKNFKERITKGSKRKLPMKPTDKEEFLREGGGAKEMIDSRGGGDSASRDLIDIKHKEDTPTQESTDDILAKYRKTPSKPVDIPDSASATKEKDSNPSDTDQGPPPYDPANLEHCKAFLDAKKKLRLVLSNADFQSMPGITNQILPLVSHDEKKENDLLLFLKAQLAEAINLQDKDLVAQLHETIRCLRQFDNHEMKKLLKCMKEEYRSRSPYIAYLVRCRQGLLSTISHTQRLLDRVRRDKEVLNNHFLATFVRLFMERKERSLMKFISDFQKLTVSDEKTDLVMQFLEYMHKQMENDPAWRVATDGQLDQAKLYIERNVMSHIYTHAMFPNGDGDIMRDQILNEHMKKLAQVITPNHKDLRIPRMYHYECPWPAAQAEIYTINAYKTPKDKVSCVTRCSSTIMNLLSLANDKSKPGADDFLPVLIYVIISANPVNLLSTLQYVNSFYSKRLHGEEQYWWMLFCSAIEFIKNMDY